MRGCLSWAFPSLANTLSVMNPKIQKVIDSIAAVYGVSANEVCSTARHEPVAESRLVAMWLGIECAGATPMEMANVIGVGARAVCSGRKRIAQRAQVCRKTNQRVYKVCQLLTT